MCRFFTLFRLHFDSAFQQRGRSFVWFLASIIPPVLLMMYWNSVMKSTQNPVASMITPAFITSYYVYYSIAISVFVAHVEYEIAEIDIKRGELSRYLVRPYPYIWLKFFEELPWKLIQGSFGLITAICFFLFFPKLLSLPHDIFFVVGAFLIAISAYILCFMYKMVLGMCAFWLEDIQGIGQISEIVMVIFGGSIMPLILMPEWLRVVCNSMPFAYFLYYPIASFQGVLSQTEVFAVLGIQWMWIGFFMGLYMILWRAGLKIFTASGS
ncbi:MAG: ABC-2 family transporter protein [Candidatus Roizmanbacteria bacterium]